jgi:hypothetical protein
MCSVRDRRRAIQQDKQGPSPRHKHSETFFSLWFLMQTCVFRSAGRRDTAIFETLSSHHARLFIRLGDTLSQHVHPSPIDTLLKSRDILEMGPHLDMKLHSKGGGKTVTGSLVILPISYLRHIVPTRGAHYNEPCPVSWSGSLLLDEVTACV